MRSIQSRSLINDGSMPIEIGAHLLASHNSLAQALQGNAAFNRNGGALNPAADRGRTDLKLSSHSRGSACSLDRSLDELLSR